MTPTTAAQRHWIITNRPISRRRTGEGKLRDVVDTGEAQALTTFRVGTFDPPGRDADDDGLQASVELIPDDFLRDDTAFGRIDPDADPLDQVASRAMFLALFQAMKAAGDGPSPKKRDTLFFIHGFNYDWPDALRLLQKLHDAYVVPAESPICQVVLFTWPSIGRQDRYWSDQRIARPSGQVLGRVFGKAIEFMKQFFEGDGAPGFCGGRIHLGAHSMGNQVLEEFCRSVAGASDLVRPVFGEALLLNADAAWDTLEPGEPMSLLPELATRIHVYNHKSDDALKVSERTKNIGRKRLGRHGPRDLRLIPPRTIVVDTSDLEGDANFPTDDRFLRAAMRVLDRDRVSARERLFDHWGYLNRAEVVSDIYHVLSGGSAGSGPLRHHSDGPLFKLRSPD